MRTKPSIFIGSSGEYASIANVIKDALVAELEVNVTVWNEASGIFQLGRNAMESILTAPHFFDYSIMLMAPDDTVVSRDKSIAAPRDNVIFELGCFLGSQGRMRAFFVLLQKPVKTTKGKWVEIKIPSDLAGEHYVPLPLTKSGSPRTQGLRNLVEKVGTAITAQRNLSFLTPLPSTVLAITYYKNFLLPMCDKLMTQSLHIADSNSSVNPGKEGFKVTVAIPKNIDRASQSGQRYYKNQNKLSLCTVDSDTRPFPFYVSLKRNRKGYQFYDVPTTLRGCSEAIRILLPHTAAGKSREQELVEKREVENFAETLQHMIETDPDGQHVADRLSIVFW